MKKLLLFFAAALCSTAMLAADFVVPNGDGVDIYYTITDADARTVETTYTGSSYNDTSLYVGDITIPETVTYEGTTYTVTGIGRDAFYKGGSLGKITLPETITYIEEYAFYGTNITEITIPENVESIGGYAFRNCASLETVVLGSKLSSIGNYGFYNCTALSSLTSKNTTPPSLSTSNTLKNIPTETCILYVPTQSIGLYQSTRYWSDFVNIVGLGYSFSVTTDDATDVAGTWATLNGVVSAGDETLLSIGFEYWEKGGDVMTVDAETIDDVNVSTVVTGLNKSSSYTFRVFAVTESGTTYGDELSFSTKAYNFMVDDIYYNIPGDSEEVEVIYGNSAAASATSTYVGDITIPESVTYEGVQYKVVGIGDHGFYACTLESVTIPASVTYIGEMAFRNCKTLAKVEILGESLDSIGYRAFMTCSALTSINLPNSVTTMGESCLEACSALPSVNIPAKLKVLPERAFYNCAALADVSFNEGLDSIGYWAFYKCESLTEINLPSTVTALGENVFELCRGITKVSLPEGLLSIGDYTFYVCAKLTDMPLPNSLERIGAGAFHSCAFTEMTIPDKITRIEEYAFTGCPLVSINLPEGLTYIGDDAFFACEELPSINLPEGLTYIGEQAFANCTSLAEITIPGSVPSIKYQTFYYCSSLRKIVLSEGIQTLEKRALYDCAVTDLTLPESLTYMDQEAIRFCYDLEEVTIPSQITTIVPFTFLKCSSLRTVNFPEGLQYIEFRAFEECSHLQQLVLPKNVVSIDYSAFVDSSLKLICSLNPTPPYCGSNAFASTGSSCILYVPEESIASYSAAPTWKNFLVTNYIPSDIQTLEATDIGVSSVTLNGTVAGGTLTITERGFEYWADGNEDDLQSITVDTTTNGDFSTTLSDLPYGTTYTYRAYVHTAGGNEYGEELTFTTAIDAPVVSTLAATNVTETSATLNGTIEVGSEEIARKGFMYWVTGSNTMRTIIIDNDEMSYSLDGLTPYTTYTYRTFATTDSNTTYGEDVQFFTSSDTTGIGSINAYGINGDNVEGIYSPDGQKLNALSKGVNIVRLKDGTTKKVYVK